MELNITDRNGGVYTISEWEGFLASKEYGGADFVQAAIQHSDFIAFLEGVQPLRAKFIKKVLGKDGYMINALLSIEESELEKNNRFFNKIINNIEKAFEDPPNNAPTLISSFLEGEIIKKFLSDDDIKSAIDFWRNKAEVTSNPESSDTEVTFNPESNETEVTFKPGSNETETLFLPNGATLKMVWCPPGSFKMGSLKRDRLHDPDEGRHKVTLTQGFWMGATAVTQGQWKSIMGTTIIDLAQKALYDNNEYFGKTIRASLGVTRNSDPADICGNIDDDIAMYFVSWYDAKEFCKKLTANQKERLPQGFRFSLPTEAQWEYACRAGTNSSLPNGKILEVLGEHNAPALDDIAWYGGNSSIDFHGRRGWDTTEWLEKQYPGGIAGPRKCGKKKPNNFGLYDMLGNVWEWCADWYGDYPTEAVKDPKGSADGSYRVLRGGSWFADARCCHSAYRDRWPPAFRYFDNGFRICLISD